MAFSSSTRSAGFLPQSTCSVTRVNCRCPRSKLTAYGVRANCLVIASSGIPALSADMTSSQASPEVRTRVVS